MEDSFRRYLLAAGCSRFVAVSLLALLLAVGCRQGDEPAQQAALAVTICHGSITDILPRIAMEQGYFANEGLHVTLKDMSDGKQAFDGLLQGECNFAVHTATPIVLADPKVTPFAILATVLSDDDASRIVARRDRGIGVPQDLKGKRIGVKKGVVGHLFFDLFLMKHGLEQNEVIGVFMESAAFQTALVNGEIDGFSMTTRMVNGAAKTLGNQAVVFAEPGLAPIHGFLMTRPDIPLNLQAAPMVLKALVRAEQYARSDPAAARALVAQAASLSGQEVEDIWARSSIEVALANTVFVHLEDQYRWQVERGGASAPAKMPNYLDHVLPGYLSAIKPESVSVIKR